MSTIRRNWTKRIADIRAAAQHCRVYDSSTGHMNAVDPAHAFTAWENNRRASLREDTPGQKWTVHVHSNLFYVLTASAPEQAARPSTAPAVPAPAPTPSGPTRSAREDAVLRKVGDYIKDAPGIGPQAAAAATEAIGRHVQAGTIREDHLTSALPRVTAAIAATMVGELRANGLTHEEIRERLERKRADAFRARDLGRVTVADALLTAHAGIVADEQAKALAAAPAPEVEAAAPRALPAAPAEQPEDTVPTERPGVETGAHRVINTGRTIHGGTAYEYLCLNQCGNALRLADFRDVRCTETAELELAEHLARRLLDDVTLRDAATLDIDDGTLSRTMPRREVEAYLARVLRFDVTHCWTGGGLKLTRKGHTVATVRPTPDPAPLPAGEVEAAAPRALPAAPAEQLEDAVPAERPGTDAGAHRVIGTGRTVHGGDAFEYVCLNRCGITARLAAFSELRCTDEAEQDYTARGGDKAAPDDYRGVPVPAFIAARWAWEPGEAWRMGVDAAVTFAVLKQASTS